MNRQKRHKQARRQSGYQGHSFQQVNGVAPDVARALSLAVEHHQAGRLSEAERIYRNLLRTHPTLPDALHLLGLVAHQTGKQDEALDSVRKALAISPQAPYYNTQGVALRARGELREAAVSFRRALGISPDFAEAHHNLGIVLAEQGSPEESIASFQRALTLNPDYIDAHSNLGLTLTTLGRFEEALPSLRRAAALKPDSAEAHANVGLALMGQGNHADAADALRHALALKPESGEIQCNLGIALRGQGKLNESVEVLRNAAVLRPDLAEVHHNLGVALCETGEQAEAEGYLRRSLALKPDYVEAHNNLGLALRALGKLDESEQSLRRALALKPDYAEAHNNLGCVLRERGQYADAEASFARAVALNPDLTEAYNNLGGALTDRGELGAAEENLRRAVALRPDYGDAHANLGVTLKKQRRLDEAAESLRRAVVLQPLSAEVHNNLGSVLGEQGKTDEAVETLHHALALKPDYADAHSNLGVVLRDQDKLDEALVSFRRALTLKPDYSEGHYNLAVLLEDLDNQDEAMVAYERAIALKADYADAHFGAALARLLQGDLEQGFAEYEWRWRIPAFSGSRPQFIQPDWDGSPLAGRTLLVYAEQGLGDTLQFARYLPLLATQGGHIVLEAQRELVPVLRSLAGDVRVVARGEQLPAFDVHAPLLSLPYLLGTTLETIPGAVPYLQPDPGRVAAWEEELAGLVADRGTLRVGLVWAGNPDHKGDRRRSLPLAALAPLAQLPGVHLLGLQKGPAAVQAEAPAAGLELTNLGPQLADFEDTAGVVQQLDLVITVDTAVAHLAGALGRPVWVLLPFAPDWRWLRGRADSPWYPSARLFRQERFGQWGDVVERVSDALAEFAGQERPPRPVAPTTPPAHRPALPRANGHAAATPTTNGHVASSPIYVSVPLGGATGWGVLGKSLAKELARLHDVRLITDPFTAETLGDELDYYLLKQLAAESALQSVDASVLQGVYGRNMLVNRAHLKGRLNACYAVFEETSIPQTAISSLRRQFEIITVPSAWCRAVLERHGCADVRVVPHGIDSDVFYPSTNDREYFRDRFVVFSGGKMELRKGQDLVIRAFKVLQDRHQDVLLVNSWSNAWEFSLNTMRAAPHIVFNPTSTDHTEMVSQVLTDNGIDLERVITLRSRPNSTMRKVYLNTDVGLFPNRCEGGNNMVMMEYMACGKPAIASYNSGHREIVHSENAVLIRTMGAISIVQDGEEIATWDEPNLDETIEQLEWAYQHRPRLLELGKQAGMDLAKLTWRRTAEQFYELLTTEGSGASPLTPSVSHVTSERPALQMAEVYHQILSQFTVSDDLPSAAVTLLEQIRKSREYAAIADSVAQPLPIDSWLQDDLHFYVFQLNGETGPGNNQIEPPTAVFTMHPDLSEPVSAVVVTPRADGQEAEIRDLRESHQAYTAPLNV
jgi:tetratricopeptide (TPR) repeat protein/glycosyltransferase involved in cell wall biosynthesis